MSSPTAFSTTSASAIFFSNAAFSFSAVSTALAWISSEIFLSASALALSSTASLS
jgi:hypothetical protein